MVMMTLGDVAKQCDAGSTNEIASVDLSNAKILRIVQSDHRLVSALVLDTTSSPLLCSNARLTSYSESAFLW
jgi:hypothetical protein